MLYQWEGDVTVHILGSQVGPPNAHAVVQVFANRTWNGTLTLDDGAPTPSDSWAFTTEDGEHVAFRVKEREGRKVSIEQFNPKHFKPPGRESVRKADGSVAIGMYGEDVDRALAEVEVFNDDTWSAVLRLEGTGAYSVGGRTVIVQPGDRFNIRADREGAVPVVARLEGSQFSGASGDEVSVTWTAVGWEDSPPPL